MVLVSIYTIVGAFLRFDVPGRQLSMIWIDICPPKEFSQTPWSSHFWEMTATFPSAPNKNSQRDLHHTCDTIELHLKQLYRYAISHDMAYLNRWDKLQLNIIPFYQCSLMCDTLGYFLKTWYILASYLLSKDKRETSVAFTVTSVIYEYRDSYVLRLPVVHVDTVTGCSLSKVQSRQTRAHHHLRKSSKQRLVNAVIDKEFLECTMNLVLWIKEWHSLIQSTRFMRRATKFWVS